MKNLATKPLYQVLNKTELEYILKVVEIDVENYEENSPHVIYGAELVKLNMMKNLYSKLINLNKT